MVARLVGIALVVLLFGASDASAVPRLRSLQMISTPGAKVTVGPVVASDRTGVTVAVWGTQTSAGTSLRYAIRKSASAQFSPAHDITGLPIPQVTELRLWTNDAGHMLVTAVSGGQVVAALKPPGASAPWSAPVEISKTVGGPAQAVRADVSHDGSASIVWANGAPGATFEVFHPIAGNPDFSNPVLLGQNASSPDVALDADNRRIVSYVSGGNSYIRVAGGLQAFAPAAVAATGSSLLSRLAADVDGNVDVITETRDAGGVGSLLRSFRVRGPTSDLQNPAAATPAANITLGDVAVDSGGDRVLAYTVSAGDGVSIQSVYARSGEGYAAPQVVEPAAAAGVSGPVMAVGSDAFGFAWTRGGVLRAAVERRGTDAPVKAPFTVRTTGRVSGAPALAFDPVLGTGVVVFRQGSRAFASMDLYRGDRVAPRVTKIGSGRYLCDERCTLRRGSAKRISAEAGQTVRVPGSGKLVARDKYGNSTTL